MTWSCSKKNVIAVTGNIFSQLGKEKLKITTAVWNEADRDRLKQLITQIGSVKMTHLVIEHRV